MNVKNILTAHAIVNLLTGLTAVLATALLLEYGTGLTVSQGTINLMRFVGVLMIGYGLISWRMRTAGHSEARTAYLWGAGWSHILFFVVAAYQTYAMFGSEFTPLYGNALLAGVFAYLLLWAAKQGE